MRPWGTRWRCSMVRGSRGLRLMPCHSPQLAAGCAALEAVRVPCDWLPTFPTRPALQRCLTSASLRSALPPLAGGSEAHATFFQRQRGDWEAATQSRDLLTSVRRFYSGMYTDAEKQVGWGRCAGRLGLVSNRHFWRGAGHREGCVSTARHVMLCLLADEQTSQLPRHCPCCTRAGCAQCLPGQLPAPGGQAARVGAGLRRLPAQR